MTETPAPVLRKPQQARSRETLNRIVEATEELLADMSFEAISIDMIVRKAGLSTGAFYSRFASKIALLHALQEDMHRRTLERLTAALSPAAWQGKNLRETIQGAIKALTHTTPTLLAVIRAIGAAGMNDPLFARSGQKIIEARAGLLSKLVLSKRDEIRHHDPQQAAISGAYVVEMTIRYQRLLPGVDSAVQNVIRNDLADMYYRYLSAAAEEGAFDPPIGRSSGIVR